MISSRRRVYASVSSSCFLLSLVSVAFAQTPTAGDSVTGTVQKLEAAGAKIVKREGAPYRVSFNGTGADAKTVLLVVDLKQLGALDLTGCRISDDDLAKLVPLSLGQIHLTGTAVTDAGMEHLAKMKTLSLVNVEDTAVGDDGLAKLVTLPRLGDLWLNGSQVTDKGLSQLRSAPNIWRLSIGGSSISNDSLKQLIGMKKLSGLTVKSSSVSDAGLRTLSTAANLRRVTLIDSLVTSPMIDQLKQTHPNLAIELRKTSGRRTTRSTPRDVSSETSGVSQKDAIAKLKSFGAKVELRGGSVIRIEFDGDKSHLGDADLSFLAGLKSLEKLDLSQTSVTDDLLKQLAGLTRLKTLSLYKTEVTWIGITELEQRIPNLKVFATPPHSSGTSWVGWVVAAVFPAFLFTCYSLVRGGLSQYRHIAQLSAEVRSGKEFDPNSLASHSGGRAFCNAAMGAATVFLLIGGSFLVTGTGEAIKSIASTDWPTVEGEVVVSRVLSRMSSDSDGHSSMSYTPIIVYQYEVDGEKHTSRQLAAYRLSNSSAKFIDKEFPIGPATVFYNPDDPVDAVLLTGLTGDNFIPIGLGAAGTLIGAIVFLVAMVKRRRYTD